MKNICHILILLLLLFAFFVFAFVSVGYREGKIKGVIQERNRFNNITQSYGKDVFNLYKFNAIIPDSCTIGFRHGDTLFVWDYFDSIEGFKFAGKFYIRDNKFE